MYRPPYDYSHTLLFQSTLNKTPNLTFSKLKLQLTHMIHSNLKIIKNSHWFNSQLPNANCCGTQMNCMSNFHNFAT